MTDVEFSHKEFERLKAERAAFKAQCRLLEEFAAMVRSDEEVEVLKKTLQRGVQMTAELTGAEKGSLFLLDGDGIVTDSILARGETSAEKRNQIVGSVLDKGLAGWVRRHRKVGLVEDTATDDRWITLPDQPYTARSALTVPILRGEELFGILTLSHSTPGHFSDVMAKMTQMTANQMGLALENIRLYQRLEEAKKAAEDYSNALDAEFEKGRQIQRDFLPFEIPGVPGWDIATCFLPAVQVSGDFFDVFELPGNRLGLVIADVCDKGVGSALFMALLRSCIRIFSGLPQSDKGIAGAGNRIDALRAIGLSNLYIDRHHSRMGMFATIFFGVLNPIDGQLDYINAGHEPLCIIGAGGIKHHLRPTGPAVGVSADAEFAVLRVHIDAGDFLCGHTDGVTEAESPEGELFSRQRLESLATEPAASAAQLMERIQKNLTNFTGNRPQSDDITMLVAHRKQSG